MRRAIAVLTAVLTAGVLGTTQAEAGDPDTDVLLGKKGPAGVTSRQPNPGLARSREKSTGQQMFSMRGKNSVAAEGGGYGCSPYVANASGLGQPDEFLEETAYVDFYGEVSCNFYLYSIEAIAGVIDRSESWQGQNFNGNILGTGTYWYSQEDYFGASQGSIGLSASRYDGGRNVEAAIEAWLLAPEGFIWDSCNPLIGLRYLACDGLGTNYLHVVVGNFGFGSGLTRVCRDLRTPLDDEQRRVNLPSGSTPASTRILNKPVFASLKTAVTSFKKDLCLKNNATEVGTLADQRGQALWNDAVTTAKGSSRPHDDRALYWARLHMTSAIHQYRRVSIDIAGTEQRLDRPSRGMTSHVFDRGTAKKAFISGFDPFQLDTALYRGNPSGASVLLLDNEIVNGAEVEVVIFPVRYEDFNDRVVEQVFDPHLRAGTQKATIITTVSQGGSDKFELEFYNGRRRAAPDLSGPLPDNRNKPPTVGILFPDGTGTYQSPVTPPVDGGAEFVQTTLPVGSMLVGPTLVDRTCDEQPPGAGSRRCPPTGPTAGSISVQGSGGGYLSNEIAYRVTRLRDAIGQPTPAGHVHTPLVAPPSGPGDPGFGMLAAQYSAILSAAITAS